jgi:hypothetical protein
MATYDRLIVEDLADRETMAAFFPAVDNFPDADRRPAAFAARKRNRPDDSDEKINAAIDDLLARDKNEQTLLLAYGSMMARHANIITNDVQMIHQMAEQFPHKPEFGQFIWRAVEDALNRAAAISRMFDVTNMGSPTPAQKAFREFRGKLLRRVLLGVDTEKFAKRVRTVRNIAEHFEEYIDDKLHALADGPEGHRLLDLECTTAEQVAGLPDRAALLRWYDYQNHVAHLLDQSVSMAELMGVAREVQMANFNFHLRARYHIQFAIGMRNPA